MNVSWGQTPTIESSSQWRQPIIFYVSQASVGPGLARPCQYISHCNIVGNEKVLPPGWLELVGWGPLSSTSYGVVWGLTQSTLIFHLLLLLLLWIFLSLPIIPPLPGTQSEAMPPSPLTQVVSRPQLFLIWILSTQRYSDQLGYTASLHPIIIYIYVMYLM